MNHQEKSQHWATVVHDCFPWTKNLDSDEDVERWEGTIKTLLNRSPGHGEIQSATMRAIRHMPNNDDGTQKIMAATPQLIVTWIRHYRHELYERSNPSPCKPEELPEDVRQNIVSIYRNWINEASIGDHERKAMESGYTILTPGEKIEEGDEYWIEGNDWGVVVGDIVGKTYVKYGNTSIRRKAAALEQAT